MHLVCREGLSGSCHETVTSVKRPTAHDHSQGSHRSPRSPVGSWTTARSTRPSLCSLRECWRCRAASRGRDFTMRVNATTIALIRFMTIDLCRHSRRSRRGIAQQTDELAHEHRGVVVQDELLVVGAGGRGHDRGGDQKARPRDGLSAEARDGLLLGRLEVRVGAGGVVGDVDDAVDLRDRLGDGYFDALAEGDCGHAAALAPPA